MIRDPLTHCRLWYFQQVQFISRAVNGTLIFVVVDVKLARPTPHGVAGGSINTAHDTRRPRLSRGCRQGMERPGSYLLKRHICSKANVARRRRPSEAQCTCSPGLGYKLCAVIPVVGQRTHGTTFRALKVTSQVATPGAVSAVYDCLVVHRNKSR